MYWLPSVTPTLVLACILWLSRNLIITRLTKSVQHEFDKKLESVKADLRTKEAEIEALRSGALTSMASRQMILDKRKLEAADQLWSAVTALAPAKSISHMMASVNFEKSAELAQNDDRVRQFFKDVSSNFNLDMKKDDIHNSAKARPFVSPMSWALYSAYESILALASTKLEALKTGIGNLNIFDKEAIANLVKTVLPNHHGYIEKYGDACYHYLLEDIETLLLAEMNKTLAGVEADQAQIEQAAKAVKLANNVMESNKRSAGDFEEHLKEIHNLIESPDVG